VFKGKKILIGVTGGIAAYKVPLLVREIKKAGGDVHLVMTNSAKEFVTPLTLSTVSGNEVIVGTFPEEQSSSIKAGTWHIKLAQQADAMLIAPATANTIAKLAHGYADNAVTTLALALRCPLIISPAMDVDMWQHPATKENIIKLRESGCTVLPPDEGELASGLVGPGRLPEISSIIRAIDDILNKSKQDLKGKRLLVSAGPTYESIDPVRFIGNRSSGKMGFALANAAALRGADVTLVAGPVHLETPRNVRRINVESAEQMYRTIMKHHKDTDAVIMAAAVADFTPTTISQKKIKKETKGSLTNLEFKKTKDILTQLSLEKRHGILVGFSLETDNGLRNAKKKLKEKHLDVIVLNNPLEDGAGFNTDTNIVTIISRNWKTEKLKKMPKFEVANEILNRVSNILSK
jgi:phosphopantothenoylcysteine decarboxylase/phosphopantothenate--cysteine ligase